MVGAVCYGNVDTKFRESWSLKQVYTMMHRQKNIKLDIQKYRSILTATPVGIRIGRLNS
jgi:hypothetical protein